MSIGRLKNIFILILALVAVYQTSQLWFEDLSGESILANFYGQKPEAMESAFIREFAYPSRIVTGSGTGDFFMVYPGMAHNNIRELCDEILEAALKSGTVSPCGTPDWPAVLAGNVVLYEYAFPMPSQEFAKALSLRSTSLHQALEAFDAIVFTVDGGGGVYIIFVNWTDGLFATATVDTAQYGRSLAAVSENALYFENNVKYISSISYGLSTDRNFFLPVWEQNTYSYSAGWVRPVYYDGATGVEKSTIRGNLLSFFDNPSAVYDATTDTNIASSDENTIVKYYDNDIIEYTSYKRDSQTTDLLDDYSAAVSFIDSKDVLLENDIYLSGYEETDNERFFYFDYILNGIPILFRDNLKDSIKNYLSSGIKVAFRDGNLVSYTRLAYGFETGIAVVEMPNPEIAQYIESSGIDMDDFKSVMLGYTADKLDLIDGGNNMNLFVEFMTMDGSAFLRE